MVLQKRTRTVIPLCVVLLTLMGGLMMSHVESMSEKERLHLRERVREMFSFSFNKYMTNAFPMDELCPLECVGRNTWGPHALTLVDSLDSLALLGLQKEFQTAVEWVSEHFEPRKNVSVSVFETNIRVVGGLLSGHFFASEGPTKVKGYNGKLLHLAREVAEYLLPAFDTPTGIPFGMVNLVEGVDVGESKVTSTAGGGTFLLEFGVLSRLLGDPKYENAARKAAMSLFSRRKKTTGLVGNHIDIFSGEWTHIDSGIGASIDSYYEYMMKSYMLFGDLTMLAMFHESLKSIDAHLKRGPWYVDVNMNTRQVSWNVYNSLQGFWPGVLAQIGRIQEASTTMRAFHGVWRLYGCVPEGFNVFSGGPQDGQIGYPLRPELMESTYHLYRATGDPVYLHYGKDYVVSIDGIMRTSCGHANVKNVLTHELDNRMESFFLSETLKYLYLLFDEENFLHEKNVVFNTEGHPIPANVSFLMDMRRPNSTTHRCPLMNLKESLSICQLYFTD